MTAEWVLQQLLTLDPRMVRYLRIEKTCLVWTGYINEHGYGRLCRSSRPLPTGGIVWLAHRYVYFLMHGTVPEELDHGCDVRACVLPDDAHVRPMGHLENVRRGRIRHPWWDRDFLVREYIEKRRPLPEIAKAEGVSLSGLNYWLRRHGIPRDRPGEYLRRKTTCKFGHPLVPMYRQRGCPVCRNDRRRTA